MMEIFRQTKAYKLAEGDLRQGRLSHAYLLLLPDAGSLGGCLRLLAQRILSDGLPPREAERVSRLVAENRFEDCRFFPAEGEKCGVAEVKAMLGECYVKPAEAARKVFVLSRVHEMLPAAQNKLLKTYEEPPSYLTVIMASSNESGILQTIKSRAKKIYADGFTVKETSELLISEGFPKNQALVAASLGDGNMERAASFLSDEKYVKLYDACFEMLLSLENSTMIVDYLYGELFTKDNAALTSDILESIFSDVLKVACNVGLPLSNSGREFDVKQIASKFNPQSAQEALFALNEGRKKLNFNVSSVRSAEGVLFDILEARYKWQ